MKPLLDITLPASLENVDLLRDAAAAVAREIGFLAEQVANVELAVEEAVTNVILHAYPGGNGTISLSCSGDNASPLAVMVSDDGVPFNPTAIVAADKDQPFGTRTVCGLGIDLMRHNTGQLTYRRSDGKNMLTLLFSPESS